MRVFLFFIDGLGLGPDDPDRNPLVRAALPTLSRLLEGRALTASSAGLETAMASLVPVDAGLGVPGLPQSATGQTAILTGVNAAVAIGRHLNAHPTPALREILARDSIFRRLTAAGKAVTFLNAYRPDSFARMAAGIYRASTTTVAVETAGLPFRTFADLDAGQAVYHDITNWTLARRGEPVSVLESSEAGRRAGTVISTHDFTLYEHFLTDITGHSQDMDQAIEILGMVDGFLGGVLAGVNLDEVTILLTSDHGNIEDLSVPTHTTNPVPALILGPARRWLAKRIRSLVDITPAIVELLEQGMPE